MGFFFFLNKHELQEELSWDSISGTTAHLREERPLILGLLDAVGHQPFHGFGAALVELAEVGGQIAPPHHVDDLKGGADRGSKFRCPSIVTQQVPSKRSPTLGTTASLLHYTNGTQIRSSVSVGGRSQNTDARQHTSTL